MCAPSGMITVCRYRLCQKAVCFNGLEGEFGGKGFCDFLLAKYFTAACFNISFANLMLLKLWFFWNVQCSPSCYLFLLFEAAYLVLVASWGLLIVPQRHLGEKADACSFLLRLAVEGLAQKWTANDCACSCSIVFMNRNRKVPVHVIKA